MSDELPFRAEYAKSSRASCKACKNKIDKDELRLAVMVQSPMFDGKVPNWFHPDCFYRRQRVKTVADIAHFDSLRWEDQQKIKAKIGGGGGEGGSGSSKQAMQAALKDFSTEYAKSGRSTCKKCMEKIEKDSVRISKMDYESEGAKMYGPKPSWHHVDCFIEARNELEFFEAADKLPGFFTLGVDDQKDLKTKLKKNKSAAPKRKNDDADEGSAKKLKTDAKEEKLMKGQSDLLYKYRDFLQKELLKKEMSDLLEFNDQEIPSGESRIMDRLSDCMAFGVLKPCPECKGQLVYSQEGYRCTGNLSEWTKCPFVTKQPKRKTFVIPDSMKEEYTFLKKYKYVPRDRIFPARTERPLQPTSSSASVLKSVKPLENMKIVVIGKVKTPRPDLVKKIETLGGKVVTKVDNTVACTISTEDEVKKMSKKIVDAKNCNIHVVSEAFIDAVQNGGAELLIAQHSLSSWGSVSLQKSNGLGDHKMSSGSRFTKSMPSKMKVKVKGAAAVDPDSGLDDAAHVLEERGSPYDAVLNKADVVEGKNSYYKLQVLEDDSCHTYWVFRSWGRVGTTIGSTKLEDFDTRQEAIIQFKQLYEEKTGNLWENRKEFVKRPKLFYPLEIDYGQNDEKLNIKKLQIGTESKLPKAVQQLICLIFDVENMKKALVEFEIDLEKMPLGKLSKRQIEMAYTVLTEAQDLIKNVSKNQNKLIDASNRFYTLIPHDFGMKKPPLLDSEDILKTKLEMLDSLLEIEVAYNLVKETGDGESKNPMDHHYHQLKTDIEVLDKESQEFKHIQTYVGNTHAATHNQYSLNIEEVFKINRHGEKKLFKPFRKLHNRMLLWHGSRVTNFAGILSQGLRIAPPEAPSTGYMFGKGIYFADMVSKSANYCCTRKNNPIGLMMLCEVALGNMYERTAAEFVTKLPPNSHSTKGLGRTVPNPGEKIVLPDGLEIPLGKGVETNVKNTSLLYNEYIVYDTAQVNIKYLLKMNFDYKY